MSGAKASFCLTGRKWCQGRGLNSRPKAYESSALPLSYPGLMAGGMSHISPAKSIKIFQPGYRDQV
jgi:hypothetical protein